MFHYFSWKIVDYWNYKILKNNFFWIQIIYFWLQREWSFFLHPLLDTKNNTLYYLWFDNIKQLELFYKLVKISWIWWKIACYISTSYSFEEISNAISKWDINFFKNVPGIWPKTAKKILIELKDNFSLEDIENTEKENDKKNIILKWIVSLWYPKTKVEKILNEYKWDLSDIQYVIKNIIKKL